MRRTAAELAEQAGAKLEGDGTLEIGGVAGPERAGARDLIYVETAKYADRAVTSAALCVVAPDGVPLPGKTVMRSQHPKLACLHNPVVVQAQRLNSCATTRR